MSYLHKPEKKFVRTAVKNPAGAIMDQTEKVLNYTDKLQTR